MCFSILGTGSYLPERIVNNDELSQFVDTSDEWIKKRVGVSERRVCTNENAVDLGVKGLPPKLFFRMHSDLEEALKMPVDLVDFDYQKDFFDLLQRVGELKKIG